MEGGNPIRPGRKALGVRVDWSDSSESVSEEEVEADQEEGEQK